MNSRIARASLGELPTASVFRLIKMSRSPRGGAIVIVYGSVLPPTRIITSQKTQSQPTPSASYVTLWTLGAHNGYLVMSAALPTADNDSR